MNVFVLILATTAGAGAHAAAPAASCSGGCGAVSGCCDPCDTKPGLLDRLRARLRKSGCCDKAPKPKVCGGEGSGCFGTGAGLLHRKGKAHAESSGCCAATSAATCDPCAAKPGLLDRLRAKFRNGEGCCGSAAPATTGCCSAAPAAPKGKVIQHGTTGQVVIPGKAPQGTYATTPAAPAIISHPAAPATPVHAQPNPSRLKLPGSDGKVIETAPKPPAKPTITTTPVLTPTAATVETETKRPFDSGRRHTERDSAADFTRVTGRLTFVRADGGRWILRYAPLSEEDGNGGSVILANDRRMSSYRDGDVVAVEGRIIAARASARFGAPLYQAQAIRLVDRPTK